uniref:DNA (cytosine-5-)-methyltransferase n=1 Tax=viral metagenome TaxID=1070528 RepID=A0A6H1ZDV0_9ZZZZ
MRFGSLFSGIEAASAAWHPLGWGCAWVAEMEPFPCAVLAHHYPDVPNLGDVTAHTFTARAAAQGPVDLIVGGSPCQAFSVAGLRNSLDDDRGNLTLRFVEIVHDLKPSWIVWENVPGVLNTKDNAFGCFLAGLAGADSPLVSPGGRWPNFGLVSGAGYNLAWAIKDAQYFGVPQRRRRVFVVASLGSWACAEALFPVSQGVRGDSAAGQEAGQVAPTIPCRRTAGGGLGTDFDCDGGLIAHALTSRYDSSEDGCGTMQVRRLTPTECSRLQGFPDNYLPQVTFRGKCPPADGPMYRALGNSMAVPVMRWIGERIMEVENAK